MAVIDVTTYNGEEELFEIRYGVLKPYVDEFIVVEFDKTFSGKPKAATFPVKKYPDVKYCFHEETLYEKYRELAESSPNTVGAAHWKREFMQKESIKDALTHLKDEDMVFIGDVDEIWELSGIPFQYIYGDMEYCGVWKLGLRVYAYWLNNRSSEEFHGTIVGKYKDIKNECLNHLRTNARKYGICGWHFTSMGGPERLRAKLTDSYTHESYASPEVLAQLEYNMAENKDFLGRPFTYQLNEEDWPGFLKENRDRYKHLIYDNNQST